MQAAATWQSWLRHIFSSRTPTLFPSSLTTSLRAPSQSPTFSLSPSAVSEQPTGSAGRLYCRSASAGLAVVTLARFEVCGCCRCCCCCCSSGASSGCCTEFTAAVVTPPADRLPARGAPVDDKQSLSVCLLNQARPAQQQGNEDFG